MNTQEQKLNDLRETLSNLPHHSISSAIFSLIDHMIECSEYGNTCWSWDNIGFSLTNESLTIVDIENDKDLAIIKVIIPEDNRI